MGKVYRPKDVIHRRRRWIPDLTPTPVPQPTTLTGLDAVLREIQSMKVEITKIKKALRAHGIAIG